MNFCKNQNLHFFPVAKKNRFMVCTFALLAMVSFADIFADGHLPHDENRSKKIKSLFAYIENPDSRRDVDRAIQLLIEMGPTILPVVKKQLKKTGNAHYFYIVQELSKKSSVKVDTKQKSLWQKQQYFLQQYQRAIALLENDQAEKAAKIAKAILVLEPDISFRSALKKFYFKAANHSNALVTAKVVSLRKYLDFGEKVPLQLHLYNKTANPITLQTARYIIKLEVVYRDFDFLGNLRTTSKHKPLSLKKDVVLPVNEHWQGILSVPNKSPRSLCYREIQVNAKIPLVTIDDGQKKVPVNISFISAIVLVLPKKFHSYLSQPLTNFIGALRLSYPAPVFYTSFFIKPEQRKEAMSHLIRVLGQDRNMSIVIQGILRRWTRKNFTTTEHWKNWWLAQGDIYEWEGKE